MEIKLYIEEFEEPNIEIHEDFDDECWFDDDDDNGGGTPIYLAA
jgi:hypothetical protein